MTREEEAKVPDPIEALFNGERVRWVPSEITGKKKRIGRQLFIGNYGVETLDEEWRVFKSIYTAEQRGVIVERSVGAGITEYELTDRAIQERAALAVAAKEARSCMKAWAWLSSRSPMIHERIALLLRSTAYHVHTSPAISGAALARGSVFALQWLKPQISSASISSIIRVVLPIYNGYTVAQASNHGGASGGGRTGGTGYDPVSPQRNWGVLGR